MSSQKTKIFQLEIKTLGSAQCQPWRDSCSEKAFQDIGGLHLRSRSSPGFWTSRKYFSLYSNPTKMEPVLPFLSRDQNCKYENHSPCRHRNIPGWQRNGFDLVSCCTTICICICICICIFDTFQTWSWLNPTKRRPLLYWFLGPRSIPLCNFSWRYLVFLLVDTIVKQI